MLLLTPRRPSVYQKKTRELDLAILAQPLVHNQPDGEPDSQHHRYEEGRIAAVDHALAVTNGVAISRSVEPSVYREEEVVLGDERGDDQEGHPGPLDPWVSP